MEKLRSLDDDEDILKPDEEEKLPAIVTREDKRGHKKNPSVDRTK